MMTRVTQAVRRRLRGDDRGVALVVVVGTMLALATLAMIALSYTVSSTKFARYDQDYTGAGVAAQSGVEDFISRMNRSDAYGVVFDCTNEAWQGPTTKSNTCGWNSSTAVGWQPVDAGNTSDKAAYFHYTVDATAKQSTGTIMLTVTGRQNGVYRTLEVALGKGGSTDYVYYTDYEDADPANVQAYTSSYVSGMTSTQKVQCGITPASDGSKPKYFWQGRSGCKEITFISSDTLDGDVFTNDTVLSSGATFKQSFQTGNPSCASAGTSASSWNSNCLRSGSTANFAQKPQTAELKYLDDNSGAFATNPGCHYYGSTRVLFKANGTMTVWNKKTSNNNTAPVSIAPEGGTAPVCGDLTSLDSAAGWTGAVPDDMVVYTATSGATSRQCYAGELGGTGTGVLPVGTYSSAATVAPTGSGASTATYTYDTNMAETNKMCNQGNLYAEGVVHGRVTLAAAQSIIVTGDLVLAGGLNSAEDMLGLVATNSVEVFHPRLVTVSTVKTSSSCSSNCTYKWNTGSPSAESEVSGWPVRYKTPGDASYTPVTGILIAGSIQTLQHSFLVQKYDVGGNNGLLNVYGSIAQRWRGIVGQGSGSSMNGYSKLYQYDSRLQYSRPPYFPTWANSQWSLRYSGEVVTPPAVKS